MMMMMMMEITMMGSYPTCYHALACLLVMMTKQMIKSWEMRKHQMMKAWLSSLVAALVKAFKEKDVGNDVRLWIVPLAIIMSPHAFVEPT